MQAYFELQSGTVIETDSPEAWAHDPQAKKISKAEGKRRLKAEAHERLLSVLKPGDTVHCVLRHVSRSGMSRRIDFYKLEAGDRVFLTGSIGHVLDMKHDRKGGLSVSGCGMDMGFSVVYELGYALFPEGFTCIGNGCPSNDHSNGDRNRKPHKHNSGGYALRHAWL